MNNKYKYVNWDLFDNVIILSTHHTNGNNQPASSSIMVNGKKYILNNILSLEKNDKALEKEHSWLVQLPFIDNTKNIMICILGFYDEKLTQEIINLIDDKTLVIANTDLLHCGENYNFTCPDDIDKYLFIAWMSYFFKYNNLLDLDQHVQVHFMEIIEFNQC
jgi:AmmeMemoRadiSam system protein B